MEHLRLILIFYIWVNFGLVLLFKLLVHEKKLNRGWQVVIYLLLPLLLIIQIISYLYKKGKVITTMDNTNKNNLKKSISTIIDRGAIRFINILDTLRGDYDK